MAAPPTSIEIPTDAVPANLCAHMVEAASQSCQAIVPIQPAQGAASVSLDAVSVSLSALSTAFTFGSILLAIIALIAGFAWGKIVAASAEKEAKLVAKDCAEEYIVKWVANKAPGIIQSHVEFLNDATIGEGDDAQAADDIGKEA